jgi:glycerophosphoryl diester phosphodiesterase
VPDFHRRGAGIRLGAGLPESEPQGYTFKPLPHRASWRANAFLSAQGGAACLRVELSSLMSLTLIAHRGYPARFPENTLVGYRAAVAAGATWLETDIQLTADGQPVLYHDAELRRTSNQPGLVADYTYQQLAQWDAAERDRWGQAFIGEPIPRLRDLVRWLGPLESISAMIELKQESLDRFSIPAVAEAVLREIATISDRCVIISFSLDALRQTRVMADVRTGWVLPAWDELHHELADEYVPDFLIVDQEILPSGHNAIWRGTWQWVVYSVDDAATALRLARRGIEYIETNAIGQMMSDRGLRDLDGSGTL